MTRPWHDINIPVHSFQKKSSSDYKKFITGVDEEYMPDKKATPVEYRIKYVRPLEPSSGYRINKPFSIEGEIDPLVNPITLPRIKIYPTGVYKGKVDSFFPKGIDAFPDENGRFKVTCDNLFVSSEYHNDREKSENATWDLVIRATGMSAEKECRSEPISFPRPAKTFIVLRKRHYDDNGAQNHQMPTSGEDYISGNDVKMLQQDLISMRFLSKGDDDGFFGDKTGLAVREFQKYAIDKYRLPLKSGVLIEITSVLQKSSPDGIIDTLTRDELDLWRKNGWIKPLPTLRHGDYDDVGVRNRLGKHGGEDHHAGTVVYDFQKSLRELGFETGAENGFFDDKTKEALIDFQTLAQQKIRILDGEEIEVKITFSGKVNGIFDELARKEQDLWREYRYRAPGIGDEALIFAAPGLNGGENGWFIVENDDIDGLIGEVNELDNFRIEIEQFRLSCCETKVKESHTEKAGELENKVNEKFEGLTKNPSQAIQELLLVKKNERWGNLSKRVYIRPYQTRNGKVRGHFRRNSDAHVKKALQKWLTQDEKNKKKGFESDAKLNALIWNSESIEKNWPWKFKTFENNKGVETDAGYFSGAYEAQFLRFLAGANATSEFDLKNMTIKLTASANASYSLAEGTVSGKWSLPDKNGFNVFSHLLLSNKAKGALHLKNDYECMFRFTIEARGKCFVGAGITAAVALPCIDLSKNDKIESGRNRTASAGVNVSGFAGASAEGKIISIVEWCKDLSAQFNALAEYAVTGTGNAGAGAEVKFEVKYENGKFRIETGVMAVCGVGGKLGGSFELNVNEGVALLAHLFDSVDFHRINAVMETAFDAYVNVTLGRYLFMGTVAQKFLKGFKSWIKEVSDKEYKESKQTVRKNIEDPSHFKISPPETLGQLLQTIVKIPEENDFEAILTILRSADGRSDEGHKLKWIIRSFHDPDLSKRKNNEKESKIALEEGIRKLMEFGKNLDENKYGKYTNEFKMTINRNGIKHAY